MSPFRVADAARDTWRTLWLFDRTIGGSETNKVAQRQALRVAGLPVPGSWSVPAQRACRSLMRSSGRVVYPVIVKPQRGASSRDTVRADDADALRSALEVSDESWIVEEILSDSWLRGDRLIGDYVSVESVVSRGHTSHAAVTGKTALADPFRETGSFISADLSAESYTAVLDVAARAIEASGVTVGMLHTEITLTPVGPRVIEVKGGSGAVRSRHLRARVRQSAHRLVGQLALGADLQYASLLPCRCVAYLSVVQPPTTARRLTRLDNLDEARQLPGVQEIRLTRRVGDELDWRVGSQGALFVLGGVADDHTAMIEGIQAVGRTVSVEYDSV